MKIDIQTELRKHTFASRVILSGITYAADEQLIKKLADDSVTDGHLEIILTANGEELNFEQFCENLEKQMDRIVLKKAKELAEDAFNNPMDDIRDLVEDLSDRLKEEINKRLDEWEKPLD